MFRNSMFFFLVLCGAMGLPYLTSQWSQVGQMFGGGGSTPIAAVGTNPSPESAHGMPPPGNAFGAVTDAPPSMNLTPEVDMAEAIRFDVTAAWVLGRWPRVTAGLPDADQQGYRVPLVTGTREDDLAGSLTYYFNKQQRCRRITFQGTTGDARRLIALVTKRFGFVQHTTSDPGLLVYQSRWNGRALSELHIRPARVVRASEPQSRFEILLALNDPDAA